MYDLNNLKQKIEVLEHSIECPIQGCTTTVRRIRRGQRLNELDFKCKEHNIYISPSTFEYENEYSNLLLLNKEDEELLENIKRVKRECRLSRERSEDALSWNIFRYLEKQKYIQPVINKLLGIDILNPELIFWSYSRGGIWKDLNEARKVFGEEKKRSTEPDIIIKGENALIFIEAKFTSSNNTSGDKKRKEFRISNRKKYDTGGDGWFDQVFEKSDYKTIIDSGKYELMRLWLLGSWIAKENGLDFYLLNLTRDCSEKQIETEFGNLIKADHSKRFNRITWEKIYDFILEQNNETDKIILDYFTNKSCGYSSGRIRKAFDR